MDKIQKIIDDKLDEIVRRKKPINHDSTLILLLPSALHTRVKFHAKEKNISVAKLVRDILNDALPKRIISLQKSNPMPVIPFL